MAKKKITDLLVAFTGDSTDLERTIGGVQKTVLRLGGVVAGAFAVDKIRDFGVESVRAFGEGEKIWNLLAGTLKNAGVEFQRVEGDIAGAARALQDVTAIGDEDFASTLQTLVRITDDYAASLAEVGTVADVAAGTGMDLGAAAQLVGRVMTGDTMMLKRYGIVVGEGADAMQVMRDRFRGLAENDAKTLEGRLAQINNEWGDFQEAIGGVIAGGDDASESLLNVRDAIKSMTEWIGTNQEELGQFREDVMTIAGVAKEPIKIVIQLTGSALSTLAERVRELKEIRDQMDEGVARMSGRTSGFGAGGTWEPAADTGPGADEETELEKMRREAAEEAKKKAAEAAKKQAAADEKRLATLKKLREEAAEISAELQGALFDFQFPKAFLGGQVLAGGAHEGGSSFDHATGRSIMPGAPTGGMRLTPVATGAAAGGPSLGDRIRGAFSSARQGDGKGALGAMGVGGGAADVLGKLGGAGMKLLNVFNPLGLVSSILQGAFEAMGPTLEPLMEVVGKIAAIFAKALVPILKALFPVFKAITIAGTYLGQIIFTIAGGIAKAIGALIKGLGTAIDKIPGLGDFGLKKAGQGLIDVGKGFGEAADGMKVAREEIKGLEWEDATAPLKEAVQEAAYNTSAAFDLNARRHQVATGQRPAVGGGAGVQVQTQDTFNITVPALPGENPRDYARRMMEAVREVRRSGEFTDLHLLVQDVVRGAA